MLVVTRSDLADPELARDEALEHLAESTLGRLPAVCVSGATGEGLDDLRAALGDLAGRLPAPDVGGDVRLWVDRAFTIRGAGTVVTGTLGAGRVSVGDELVLAGRDGERTVAVRGLQSLGEPVETARGGLAGRGEPARCAARGAAPRRRAAHAAAVADHGVVDVRAPPAAGTAPAGRGPAARRR